MDIDFLLQRLEEALTSGSRIPFSRRSLIDEEECLAIVEQIREAVPDEIQRARRTNQDRERVLAEAHERAQIVLAEADEQAADRLGDHAQVRAAEVRAAQIQDEAEQQGDEIRRQADEYAYQVMERLEQQLATTLKIVQRGMRELEQGPDPRAPGPTEPR